MKVTVKTAQQREPTFEIPLRRSELEALGRCAVIFGQIDMMLTMIISHLVYLDTMAGFTMLDDVTTGRKLGILRRNLYRVENQEALTVLDSFDKKFSGLVERRNHMFHGIWGWHAQGDKTKPGCCYPKNKDVTIYPDKIAVYAERLSEQSHAIRRAFCLIIGTEPPPSSDLTARFHFADDTYFNDLKAHGIQTTDLGRPYKGRRGQGITSSDGVQRSQQDQN